MLPTTNVAFVFYLATVSESLRLASFDVPSSVKLGDDVRLNCSLDLETDELYSVKWYRNGEEFYRFLPRDRPNIQKFDLSGVHVDASKSTQGFIYLTRTNYTTEGIYRCEASAEAPSFQTVSAEKELTVYALPTEDPTIVATQAKYEVGDEVNVTCRSGKSRPPAKLKWFINNNEAAAEFLKTYPLLNESDGTSVTIVKLYFVADPSYFRGGTLNLRCTAIVSHVDDMSSEQIVIRDNVLKTDSPVYVKGSENAPAITGNEPKYRVGDYVNVTCTSALSKPDAELSWFINEKQSQKEFLMDYSTTRRNSSTKTSVLGLQFVVQPHHFDQNGELRLKCTATISRVIHTRDEEMKIVGSHHQRTSGLHASESVERVRSFSKDTRWSHAFPLVYVVVVLTALPHVLSF